MKALKECIVIKRWFPFFKIQNYEIILETSQTGPSEKEMKRLNFNCCECHQILFRWNPYPIAT